VALAGDRVHVLPDQVLVNGRGIAGEELPERGVPFPREAVSFTVSPGEVLAVSALPELPDIRDVDLAAQVWQNTFLLPESAIEGRAVGLYRPLRRRRFFDRNSLR
jgi:hypothetical protein